MSILLGGMVLTPLLTSIVYSARCGEGGLDVGTAAAVQRLDFSDMDAAARASSAGVGVGRLLGALHAGGDDARCGDDQAIPQ